MHVDDDLLDHPESLIDLAIRGELGCAQKTELARHLAGCPACATELESARLFRAAVAPRRRDEALNRAAVETALERLEAPPTLGERLRRWRGFGRMLRPATVLLGAAAVAAVGIVVIHGRQPLPAPAPAPTTLARPFLLADGSEVTPVEAATAIQIAEQTPTRTTVRLGSGSAKFRVRHDERRRFRVDAGSLRIEDLGTVFLVAHQAGDKVRVKVSEGRVAVSYPATGVRIEIAAGEDRVFSAVPEPSPLAVERAQAAPKPQSPALAAPTVRSLSRPRSVEDPGALLLAADAARRGGRPQAAVAALRRLVERYPRDPRAPSAAFTLGWVLLTDLGRAREAAAAFAQAERIAPRGALAEDAAARVAEAWHKSGDLGRTAQAVRHYEQVYPTGRYKTLMRGLVGEQ